MGKLMEGYRPLNPDERDSSASERWLRLIFTANPGYSETTIGIVGRLHATPPTPLTSSSGTPASTPLTPSSGTPAPTSLTPSSETLASTLLTPSPEPQAPAGPPAPSVWLIAFIGCIVLLEIIFLIFT